VQSSQTWKRLSEELREALRDYTSAHNEQYVLGGDDRIDWLYESLWGLLLENAPEFVPLMENIPAEYIDQIEQDNKLRELLEQAVEKERQYLTYRHEKQGRKTKTLTFLATPK
jgi:hypothetical protein